MQLGSVIPMTWLCGMANASITFETRASPCGIVSEAFEFRDFYLLI